MNTNEVLNKLIAEIERRINSWSIRGKNSPEGQGRDTCESRVTELSDLLSFITSLQQDKEALELEMCAEYWWEERGWIMIPPNVTLKGIESLLNQVKKKLQQEQPEVDIKKEIDELWKSLNTGHDYVIVDSYIDFLGLCLHCFELGLNARKED